MKEMQSVWSRKLERWDSKLWSFLMETKIPMPRRVGRLVASHYPDARIRKKYASYLWTEMDEGTYANLGMTVVPNENPICVHIGKYVSIAPNVTFICSAEPNNGKEIRELPYVKERLCQYGDIVVDDEAWLGAGCIIFPGVKVGRCAVIGAGSVLRTDAEPYGVYAGVPARKIRDLRTGERCEK